MQKETNREPEKQRPVFESSKESNKREGFPRLTIHINNNIAFSLNDKS